MTYGPLTVAQWAAHHRATGEYLHVFLDGQDVTEQCCFSDDEAGFVVRYVRVRDESGRAVRDAERVFGHVEVIPEPSYPEGQPQ
jgi:hypothetical protein